MMNMSQPFLPLTNEDSKPYWEAANRSKLLYQLCLACSKPFFFPRSRCPHCHSEQWEWRESGGRGTVYTYSQVCRPPSSYFKTKVPYIVAMVDLEEGYRMLATCVDVALGEMRAGLPVSVAFERLNDEFQLPVFRPER